LKTDTIIIGKNAFIGARAFIFPGIKIGNNALVGACSVVTKNVPDNCKALGNPAKIKN
jgi:acetyltransferase-like isoleucine patch superfamily enzyme